MTAYIIALTLLGCGPKASAPSPSPPPPAAAGELASAPRADAMPSPAPDPLPDLDALLDFRDPARSEAAYRELLPLARAHGLDAELGLLTRVARTQGLQGRFDEAIATLDEVEARANGASPEVIVRLLLEDGRVLNSSGHPEPSAAFFEEAWSRATEAGLAGLAVDAAHMLGIVLPPDPALEWNLQAIAAAEASTDPAARRWLGALYNNTGWTFMDRGEPARALQLFEKGLAWRAARDDPRATRIARYTVAAALRRLDRCDEALPMLRELLVAWEQAGEEDGYVHEELAECLAAMGQVEQARPHYAAAWRLLALDSWLSQHEAERLARLARLGGVATSP